MGATDSRTDCTCDDTVSSRCDARLPDNPACAIHYHFGMLLGVDDFRTEQGFHVGRLRRHQRALHGAGVVTGYDVTCDPALAELRVSAGYAIDTHGRDLEMLADQCLGLPAWWLKHRDDDDFFDVPDKDNVTFDATVQLCYTGCLSRPVPAIADLCAGGSADIAYSRICESVRLQLVVQADDACLTIASLTGIHIFLDHSDPAQDVWKADVAGIATDQRPVLLPTHVLQASLQALTNTAGPVVQTASVLAAAITLVFDQPLAPASVAVAAFTVSAFDPATGWSITTMDSVAYDGAMTVTLHLTAAPSGARIRITVHGRGPTPLLGADFIPAGARTSDSDGSNLATTIVGE